MFENFHKDIHLKISCRKTSPSKVETFVIQIILVNVDEHLANEEILDQCNNQSLIFAISTLSY